MLAFDRVPRPTKSFAELRAPHSFGPRGDRTSVHHSAKTTSVQSLGRHRKGTEKLRQEEVVAVVDVAAPHGTVLGVHERTDHHHGEDEALARWTNIPSHSLNQIQCLVVKSLRLSKDYTIDCGLVQAVEGPNFPNADPNYQSD